METDRKRQWGSKFQSQITGCKSVVFHLSAVPQYPHVHKRHDDRLYIFKEANVSQVSSGA